MVSFGVGREAGTRLRRAGWLLHAGAVGRRLRALEYTVKSSFDPNQPRVPAGNPDGGQWTSTGGSGGSDAGQSERIRLAQNEPRDHRTDIPKIRPPSVRERNRAIRRVATLVAKLGAGARGGRVGLILAGLDVAQWVYEEISGLCHYHSLRRSAENSRGAAACSLFTLCGLRDSPHR